MGQKENLPRPYSREEELLKGPVRGVQCHYTYERDTIGLAKFVDSMRGREEPIDYADTAMYTARLIDYHLTFNKKGLKQTQVTYAISGNNDSLRFQYRRNGKMKIMQDFSHMPDSPNARKMMYYYDKLGKVKLPKLTKQEKREEARLDSLHNAGNYVPYHDTQYDSLGNIILQSDRYSDIEYQYDGQGRMIYEKDIVHFTEAMTETTWTYDSTGYVKKTYDLVEEGDSLMRTPQFIYTFNRFGDMTDMTRFSRSGDVFKTEHFENIYDERGNWTSQASSIGLFMRLVRTRKICYY